MRLRLINAADRFITLRIDRHPMHVMAIDGQPAEPFGARDSRVTLAPGNRADLFVDAVLEPGSVAPIVVQDDGADVPLARLVYAAERAGPRRSRAAPQRRCRQTPLPERIDFARRASRAELALDARRPADRPATAAASRCSAAAP